MSEQQQQQQRSDTTRHERKNADPRVDKAIGYAFQVLMTIAISVGGWYARGTGEKVDALMAAQAETRTDLAVMRTEIVGLRASAQDTVELRRTLSALQLQITTMQSEVTTLRRDLDRPR